VDEFGIEWIGIGPAVVEADHVQEGQEISMCGRGANDSAGTADRNGNQRRNAVQVIVVGLVEDEEDLRFGVPSGAKNIGRILYLGKRRIGETLTAKVVCVGAKGVAQT
jgi:hypothetical protein